MSSNNNTAFNLMDLLVSSHAEDETTSLYRPTSTLRSFGWQDFPIVHHAADEEECSANEDTTCLSNNEPQQAQAMLKLLPPPAMIFDSFAWRDFPVVNSKPSDATVSTMVTTDSDSDTNLDDDIDKPDSLRSVWSWEQDEEAPMDDIVNSRHRQATSRVVYF